MTVSRRRIGRIMAKNGWVFEIHL
ncbi:hypothetical protein [Gilliamella sp. GillExp13]